MDQKDPATGDAAGPTVPEREDAPARHAEGRLAAMRTYGTLGSVGLSFVFALLIGAGVGLWLDRLTGWSPFFFIVLFLCGVAAGIHNISRTVSRLK
jgi:F0F1-type ATP synthase assembly protein I